jgi:hypothetical protein
MKTLLKRTMSLVLSLALILGLTNVQALVAKADVFEGGVTTFNNITSQDHYYLTDQNGKTAKNGLSTENVNGYDFTVTSNSDKQDTYFSVSNLSIGSARNYYLAAFIRNEMDPVMGGMETNNYLESLSVDWNNGSSFDLNAVEVAAGSQGSAYLDLTLTGYKGNVPVPGAELKQQVQSLTYMNGKTAVFDVSNNSAFDGIDSFKITAGQAAKINVGVFVKSITAYKHQENTNTAPTATEVTISQDSAGQLTGNYIYTDAEGDAEGNSLYQWYRGEDSQGTGKTPITGANSLVYTPVEEDYGKYIGFLVTPIAATGNRNGMDVVSDYYGPIHNNTTEDEWSVLKSAIETYEGVSGNLIAVIDKEQGIITVTGDLKGADKSLILNIPKNIKIVWKADFESSADYMGNLINLNGSGIFEVAQGGKLTMSGGGNVITSGESFSEVIVNGGNIVTAAGYAIKATGEGTYVTIKSGTVNCYDGTAIITNGSNSVVTIYGGVINVEKGTAITTKRNVIMYNGLVNATAGTAISTTRGVYAYNGTISSKTGDTIIAERDLYIQGKAKVTAAFGTAINLKGSTSKINLSGGLIFSYYNTDLDYNVYKTPDNPAGLVNTNGVIVEWDQSIGKRTYVAGTSDDIRFIPENATAYWDEVDGISGITVDYEENFYFIPVTDVTVVTDPEDTVWVSSVTIKTPPAKTTYNVGDALDLAGLVITLNKSDESSEDIAFDNFSSKGITVNPVNGQTLIKESSVVIITYTKDDKSAYQNLTINNSGAPTETPTITPIPTTIPIPTTTPVPTITPVPTATPIPTATPVPSVPTSSPVTPTTATEQIIVDVKKGDTDGTATQIAIERTTKANREKSDKVTYQKEKAVETVQKLKEEGKDTARIVIPDVQDEVSETTVNVPVAAVKTLADGKINLQIDTEEAKISLPKESIIEINSKLTEDLYFYLVPVKQEEEKKAVIIQAKLEAAKINNNANNTVSIIGNPVTIETNMPSTSTDIILPLSGLEVPTNTKAREALLKQLAVYIVHSDGDKELVQGELVEYKEGVYGIRFHINKFSTFSVVKTDAFMKSSEKDIISITTPSKAVISKNTVSATVANDVSSLKVKAVVSDKAEWKLYLDKDLKKEAVDGKLSLVTGNNVSYIKITAEDKTTKTYKLEIVSNKSVKAEITQIIVPEKAKIKGAVITATVAYEKTSLTIKALVSSKAAIKVYSDKNLKKEISKGKLNLKVGVNTVYLKVIAENGKSVKVFTLKITRNGQEYNSRIRLGVIGSEAYAKHVAQIFEKDYDSANVEVRKSGKYYQVTMEFKDNTEAKKACKDMVRREYIINYYFD